MRRSRTRSSRRDSDADGTVEAGPHDLTGLFGAPSWLRDLGATAWLVVGVTLALVGAIWVLSLTQTIVAPVIAAAVIAAVTSPVAARLVRRGLPRGAAAALLLLALLLVGVAVLFIVLAGITSQTSALASQLQDAKDTIAGWLTDLGVSRDAAQSAMDDASSALGDAVPALLEGLGAGLKSLSSLVVFLSLTVLSLFFLLKDGPLIRRWVERHMRVPPPVAHAIGGRVLESLRSYFFGVTLVAAFNAVVVGLGAAVLGVPLAGRSPRSPFWAPISHIWAPGGQVRSACSSPWAGRGPKRRSAWWSSSCWPTGSSSSWSSRSPTAPRSGSIRSRSSSSPSPAVPCSGPWGSSSLPR